MPAALVALIPFIIEYGPSAIAAIEELVAEVKSLYADGDPTAEQWAALDAKLQASHAKLQALQTKE